VEETVVFLTLRFPIPSLNKESAFYSCRETANKNEQFKKTKILKSNSYLIRKAVPLGTVVNQPSLPGGSFKITLTVPLILAYLF